MVEIFLIQPGRYIQLDVYFTGSGKFLKSVKSRERLNKHIPALTLVWKHSETVGLLNYQSSKIQAFFSTDYQNDIFKNLTSRLAHVNISAKYWIAGRNLSCISQQKRTVLLATMLPKLLGAAILNSHMIFWPSWFKKWNNIDQLKFILK